MNTNPRITISRNLGIARRALKIAQKEALENIHDEEMRVIVGPLEMLILQMQTLSSELPWIAPSTRRLIELEQLDRELRDRLAETA